MKYYCKHCEKTVNRDSNKAWVKSFCETAGKTVHLMLVKKQKKSYNEPNAEMKDLLNL